MKLRRGFISNSSSSSFIIGSKKELTEPMLYCAFKINKDTPLKGLLKQIINYIVDNSKKINSVEEWFKENWCTAKLVDGWEDEVPESIIGAFAKFQNVYELECSNEDGDAVSLMLYNGGGIECEGPTLSIKGYY